MKAYADDIVARASESEVAYLSFPGELLEIVNEFIAPRLPGVRLLTWYPHESISRPESRTLLREVSAQEDLDVVLVGYATAFNR